MADVTQRYASVQYDGTNGSYIAGTWNIAITFISDNGTTFVFRDGDGVNHSVAVNDWLVQQNWDSDSFPQVLTPTQYAAQWLVINP